MVYVSDKQKVELLLIPQIMLNVLSCAMEENEPNDDAARCRALLIEAINSVTKGATEPAKLFRRANRVHEEVTREFSKVKARVDKVGLTMYFVIKSITDADYIIIGEDTALQRAFDIFFPVLERSAEIAPLIASSRKQGRKMLEHFQKLGYYAGVRYSGDEL